MGPKEQYHLLLTDCRRTGLQRARPRRHRGTTGIATHRQRTPHQWRWNIWVQIAEHIRDWPFLLAELKKNFLLYPHLILTQLGKIPRQNHLESLLFFNSLFLGWFSTVITTLCYIYSQQGGLVGEGDWHAILTAYIHSIPGTHSGRRELTAYPWE